MKYDIEDNNNESFVINLFKTKTGNVRLVWIMIIVTVCILGVILSSRSIFVLVMRQIYLGDGYMQDVALEKAQNLMMTNEVQAALSVIDTILMILAVILLITRVDRLKFQWSSIGLNRNSSSIPYFLLGTLLGFLFILVTRGVGLLVGTVRLQSLSFDEIFTPDNVKFMILYYVWAIFNGFWQEIIFRGYFQNKLVERYKVTLGILTATIYFVLVHFIDRQLTFNWVTTAALLSILIGSMFHKTKSLYLVGAMHGSLNYLDPVIELMGFEYTSAPAYIGWIANMLILIILLGIYFLIYHYRTKTGKGTQTG